tara:strand:- start:1193 stop:1573 length:381 start_codon:yes stop_codon:yes gene_type:complete
MKELLIRLIKAKENENKCKAERISLEEQIAPFLKCDLGKTKTYTKEGFRVNVKRPVSFKLDSEIFEEVKKGIPYEDLPIKTKTEIDVKAYEYTRLNNPSVFKKISEAVTMTSGKVAIKAEVVSIGH